MTENRNPKGATEMTLQSVPNTAMCERNVHYFTVLRNEAYHCRDCGISEGDSLKIAAEWAHIHESDGLHCRSCGVYFPRLTL